jgi:hypothetical protein
MEFSEFLTAILKLDKDEGWKVMSLVSTHYSCMASQCLIHCTLMEIIIVRIISKNH